MSTSERKASIKWVLKRSVERQKEREGLVCQVCGKSIQAKEKGGNT